MTNFLSNIGLKLTEFISKENLSETQMEREKVQNEVIELEINETANWYTFSHSRLDRSS